MKVGIVGVGAVGASIAMTLTLRSVAQDVVLIDTNEARAKGLATDMIYGMPLVSSTRVRKGGYGDLKGAGLVIVAAGINEKAGGATDRSDPLGRLRLLKTNAEIFAAIIPRIVDAAPEAVILIATNPPEPLVEIARRHAGHDRVLSSSTALDTLRFRVHLAGRLDMNPNAVDAYVVGEHGTNSVLLWSSARVGATPVLDILAERNIDRTAFRQQVENDVRFANISIIEGLGASQYGIGIVAARLAEVILRDERIVLPVGSHLAKFGVTLSFPSVVGRQGVADVLVPEMSDEENAALERCAARLRETVEPYLAAATA
ncbi:lactate/malate family dehydrogenase [Terrihabitans sp. B22-R8]|uniref:lactate/malate family dehydrogenase n=1 Tax=Terrihabitans sp. B22-R8 TaxID=3425128 RepID=UPI00403C6631